MTTFTIDNDNNITAFATPEEAQDALALGAQAFTSQKELAKLTSEWSTARLVETWNGFAGAPGFGDLKPVKKFTDRKVAINRIWQAIQKLAPAAEGGAQDAPEAATTSTAEASPANGAKKAVRGARKATSEAKAAAKDAPAMREGTKKAKVLELLSRPKGATLGEIMKATKWQSHTVRGFISGSVTKRMNLAVESSKNDKGERTYRVAK